MNKLKEEQLTNMLATIKYEGRPLTTYIGGDTTKQLVALVDALLESKEKETVEKCAAICDTVSEEYSVEVDAITDKTPAKLVPSFWKLSGSFACAMKIRQANREIAAHRGDEK